LKKFVLPLIALFVLPSALSAGAGRKVVRAAQPVYPSLAKQMRLSGTVRLEATVASSGKVSDVKVIGGNPVLSQSAAEAARKWQYEPASTTTVEEISFNFVPTE